MALFIVAPTALAKLVGAEPEVAVPKLKVTDCRDNYCTSEGDGLWIEPFLNFLEQRVRERAHVPGFQFSDTEAINEELLEEVKSTHVRALLIEFTNAHYERWRDDDIEYPNYDDIRDNARGYCEECDSGWQDVFGQYDGPLPSAVPRDEDENEAGIAEEERRARHRRNSERQAERRRRQAAMEEAENEVVDRDWICDDDCDSFCDHINEQYRDAFEPNTAALKARWEEFLAERVEKNFPPLTAVRR
jgi:hypothetical protein